MGVGINIAPGQGELFELSYLTFDGIQTALFFEAVPGGALESLLQVRYKEDPHGFKSAILKALKEYFPSTFERINVAQFKVSRPQDVLQGAITPTVRRGYARLDNGKNI